MPVQPQVITKDSKAQQSQGDERHEGGRDNDLLNDNMKRLALRSSHIILPSATIQIPDHSLT